MEFAEIVRKALDVKLAYALANQAAGHKTWDTHAYTTGLNGDIGDLNKIIGAKYNFRQPKGNIQQALGHELCDIIWSVFCIADEEGIDIEQVFLPAMEEILARPELAQFSQPSQPPE